jgi:hypothetical protein
MPKDPVEVCSPITKPSGDRGPSNATRAESPGSRSNPTGPRADSRDRGGNNQGR